MAETQDTGLIKNVNDEEYDGRTLVPEDNQDGVENYIGVDPIYQNYANETEKPYPFSDEEVDRAAERGGVVVDANSDDGKDDEPDEQPTDKTVEKKTAAKKTVAPPTASVPQQKSSSPDSSK